MDTLELLANYYEIYLIQKETSFYNPGVPFELDLSFNWKLRPSFKSKDLMANPAPSQFYAVLDQLFSYTSDILQEEIYSPLELKSFVSNSLYQMMTQIEKQDIDSSSISAFKLQMIYQIQNAQTQEEFKKELNTILSNLSIIIQSYLQHGESEFKNRMFNYLNDHFHENIGLDHLAKHFNFSYHYMSELFNNHFDASLSDVLNNLRIQKSIELLENPKISLKDICHKVGYSNYSHFSKLFKKYQNMSPSEYRQEKLS